MVSVEATAIADVKLVTPERHLDRRGHFTELWNARDLAKLGLAVAFVQDNLAVSERNGTLRGLHFQRPPGAQGKLVQVLRGSIFDVALDLRPGEPSYGRHVSARLDSANGKQLWIPPGFAHGYCTLSDDCMVMYKVTQVYEPSLEEGIRWSDPALAIQWPVPESGMIVSERDRALPSFEEWEAGG